MSMSPGRFAAWGTRLGNQEKFADSDLNQKHKSKLTLLPVMQRLFKSQFKENLVLKFDLFKARSGTSLIFDERITVGQFRITNLENQREILLVGSEIRRFSFISDFLNRRRG